MASAQLDPPRSGPSVLRGSTSADVPWVVVQFRETDAMDLPAAVVAFARGRGVDVESPVLLRSTNNVVAWLAPSNVVAKVAVNANRASDELVAAQMLVSRGAPVVAPAIGLGDRVHRIDGNDVTFWNYVPPITTPPTSASVAAALASLHDHLRTLGTDVCPQLPDCREPFLDTLTSLDRATFAPTLTIDDRAVLRRALNDGCDALADRTSWQPIHGSPHRFNIVADDTGPRFIDFETIAFGPVEWDLAHLEAQVSDNYPDHIDARLLGALRLAISAMTAALCWHASDRGPDMIGHAMHHLEIVRNQS